MSALEGQGGELRFTLQITSKATGKTESVEMVSRLTPEQDAIVREEVKAGRIHAAEGAMIGSGSSLSNEG